MSVELVNIFLGLNAAVTKTKVHVHFINVSDAFIQSNGQIVHIEGAAEDQRPEVHGSKSILVCISVAYLKVFIITIPDLCRVVIVACQ